MARPKVPLVSRAKAFQIALDVVDEFGVDEFGVDEFSVREVARRLGVNIASMYHHVDGKAELLQGAARAALENVRPPVFDRDWRVWLLESVRAYHRALRTHPNLIPIFAARHPYTNFLDVLEVSAQSLVENGVPAVAVAPLIDTLHSLVWGSVTYEAALERHEMPESWRAEYPNTTRAIQQAGFVRDETFLIAARAIMDAIVDAATPPPNGRKSRSRP